MHMLSIHEDFGFDDLPLQIEFHQIHVFTIVTLGYCLSVTYSEHGAWKNSLTLLVRGHTSSIDRRPRLLSSSNHVYNLDLVLALDIGHTVHLIIELSESFLPPIPAAEFEVVSKDLRSS